MNRFLQLLKSLGFTCLLLLLAAPAQAVLIDFAAYADHQNLNGLNLGGVTLTAPSGSVEVFSNRFGLGYHSSTNAVGNFYFSGSADQSNPLTGVFVVPVTMLSLWGGDGGNDSDSWRLDAYDSLVGGSLVGSVASGTWNGNPYRQLSISYLAGIKRFEAFFTGPSSFGVGYDDLEFTPVPEPAAALLIIWGLLLCNWRSSR
jgi:hypothetical protein